jgi:hypothetical protein
VSASVAASRVLVAEVTDARSKRTHLVTEQAFLAGCRAGRYQGICGDDAPLWGVRETENWRDTIYLGGVREPDSCSATRRRKSSLLVPGDLLVTEQISKLPRSRIG